MGLVILISVPNEVNAWTQVSSNFSYDDDEQSGGGWTYYQYDRDDGSIKIQHDQWSGTAECHIYIGHKVTTPSYGSKWKIQIEMKHMVSYDASAYWPGYVTVITEMQLHDDNHGVDWEYTTYSKSGQSYEIDTTKTYTRYPINELDPSSDWYVVLHVYLKFYGWSVMHSCPGSGNSYARFDLQYIEYQFVAAYGGGDPPV